MWAGDEFEIDIARGGLTKNGFRLLRTDSELFGVSGALWLWTMNSER